MGTYELKFDPASQFSVPNGELEGLSKMFDSALGDDKDTKHH